MTLDKKQANVASQVVMSEAIVEQARQRERRQPRPVKPWWRALGLGLTGFGVGLAIGSSQGKGLLYAFIGFGIGVAIVAVITRTRR